MRPLLALAALFLAFTAQAEENPELARISAADDARVAAMKARDGAKLSVYLSDDLHYAHSNALVDTKASFLDLIVSGKAKYLRLDYVKRDFAFPAPGVATMTGFFDVKAVINEASTESRICFLGVWRKENGEWKLFAWQTCKVPPATPAK
jgi:hypothetical protein